MCKEKEGRRPSYEVLLQEIEESCNIISLLRTAGYEFDRPAMAAERAHLCQLLEILERIDETAGHVNEICQILAYHIHRTPPPVNDVIKHARDRIWPYNTFPPPAKKEK